MLQLASNGKRSPRSPASFSPPRLSLAGRVTRRSEMLDGILGRGFSARCKSLIKLTRTRIDVIQRKRGATEKFLKKDVADLLSNGLDINAYGRAEGLLVEITLSSCYLYIELCCQFLLKQLSLMQKVRECPENCREAVSSLMYAAARFSDLPELRDLRQAFQERYGNSLDHFVNQEFAERMAAKPSTMEKKVKLMQDIASEYSISWDAKAFEQRMSRPPSLLPDDRPKHYGSPHPASSNTKTLDNKSVHEKKTMPEVSLKQRLGESDDQNFCSNKEHNSFRRHNGILENHPKAELLGNRHEMTEESVGIFRKIENGSTKQKEISAFVYDKSRGEESPFETDRSGTSRAGKNHDGGAGRSNRHIGREKYHSERDFKDNSFPNEEAISDPAGLFLKKEFSVTNHHDSSQLLASQMHGKVLKEEAKRPQYKNGFPPPYVKPNSKLLKERECEDIGNSISSRGDVNGRHKMPSIPKSDSSNLCSDETQAVSDHPTDSKRDGRPTSNDKGFRFRDDAAGHFLPRPKSVRRRRSKSRPIFDDSSHEDADSGRRTSRSSRRREEARKGLQVLINDECEENNEEERIIDRLLMHYSKKPSTYERGKLRRKAQGHREHAIEGSSSKPDDDEELQVVHPPRSASLPHQQMTEAVTPAKKFTRAASFEPARHVHPKLPEYDDLAARLASLRGS